jgi:AmmeMemoRadiSam system protein B
MAQVLSRLRMNLDFMPSPVPDRPGLLVRDSYHYSDATLIIPPVLVECLQCFDGQQTELDLRATLVRITGDLQVGEVEKHLIETLSKAGFLENDIYEQMKQEREAEFAAAPTREPVHAGSAYPAEPDPLRETLRRYMDGVPQSPDSAKLLGIAAPHVSPEGGWECYRAAYQAMGPQYRDRIFVVLGTSHYGMPDRFGLTRKPFETPLGQTVTESGLVSRLAAEAGSAIAMEDYCHSVEHSIEFQVLFLQHLYGPDIRILPILCGSFARSIYGGAGKPEDDEDVRRFLGALGEMAAREGERLFWVLGIDMAHMGRRYGDPFAARADEDQMQAVARRDQLRIESITQGDQQSFWSQVQENQDDLKWCGSAPLYTFLKTVPQARGRLLRYQQWNIDEQSVVSFGALAFG